MGDVGHPHASARRGALSARPPNLLRTLLTCLRIRTFTSFPHGDSPERDACLESSSQRAGDVASDHSFESHGQITSPGFSDSWKALAGGSLKGGSRCLKESKMEPKAKKEHAYAID